MNERKMITQLYTRRVNLSFSPAPNEISISFILIQLHHTTIYIRIGLAKYKRKILPGDNNLSPLTCVVIHMRELLVEFPAVIYVCGAPIYV